FVQAEDGIRDFHVAGVQTCAFRSAERVGSGFHMNPSPGNIKDGLITDAIKSNGAVKKGGIAPIVDVLDYTEPALRSGLNLVCTRSEERRVGEVSSVGWSRSAVYQR